MRVFGYVSLALMILTVLAISKPIHARNSTKEFLNAHNAARAKVGVPKLTWDATLATYARNGISGCNYVNRPDSTYGENSSQGTSDVSAREVVNSWVAEKAHYNYTSNTCEEFWECGNYKQVVWRNSKKLGCARAECSIGPGVGWMVVICNYYPPGNIDGQWPY